MNNKKNIQVYALFGPKGNIKAEIDYNFFVFSGGEEHIKINNDICRVNPNDVNLLKIDAFLKNSSDVMRLLMLTDALRRIYLNAEIELELPYIPYSRQDRVCNYGEAFSLKVFANLLNSQKYKRVYVQDPHSDVSGALIDNVIIKDITFDLKIFLLNLGGNDKTFTLIVPDAGALKKAYHLTKELPQFTNIISLTKVRELSTGNIKSTEINNSHLLDSSLGESTMVLVDDICDGGATFIGASQTLKSHFGDNINLNLFVTNGIFSKGKQCLLEHYQNVYAVYDWTA